MGPEYLPEEQKLRVLAPVNAALRDSGQDDNRVLTASELLDLGRANMECELRTCAGKISGDSGAARLIGIPASTFTSQIEAVGIAKPNVGVVSS